jgi:hypothetical protein
VCIFAINRTGPILASKSTHDCIRTIATGQGGRRRTTKWEEPKKNHSKEQQQQLSKMTSLLALSLASVRSLPPVSHTPFGSYTADLLVDVLILD